MTFRGLLRCGFAAEIAVSDISYGVGEVSGRRTVLVRRDGVVASARDLAVRGDSRFGSLLSGSSLQPLLAAGRQAWRDVWDWLTSVSDDTYNECRIADGSARLVLPFEVADYVDFYSSETHATNVGRIFRPDGDALPANWLHLPIGYHGRAGTVVVSGTPISRPLGQRKPPDAPTPEFGPSTRLDVEVEVGFVVGTGTTLGSQVAAANWREHVFGVVLLNDWSARDIQAWEYVPLGPFLGKSFATSISAWVTPLDALEFAWVSPPSRRVEPLPYLQDPSKPAGLDLELELSVNGTVVSRPVFREMYWTAAQQLAHMTVNGASLRTGDLYASGTVSGSNPDQFGSLLELTWNATRPMLLSDGRSLGFLKDGDEVRITGTAPGADGGRVTLGEVSGRIVAST
jgi:fumarylacetoacetase